MFLFLYNFACSNHYQTLLDNWTLLDFKVFNKTEDTAFIREINSGDEYKIRCRSTNDLDTYQLSRLTIYKKDLNLNKPSSFFFNNSVYQVVCQVSAHYKLS